jgi:hypothetical protein
MLSNWGYVYFHLGQGLGYAEVDLQNYRKADVPAGLAPQAPSKIEPDNPIIKALYGHLCTVETMTELQDLGTIPRDVTALKAKIDGSRNALLNPPLSTDENIERRCAAQK